MKEQLFCSISYNVHDSSASFAINNRVVLVLEAERIFREKKKRCNKDEMEHLINIGLKYLGKKPEDVSRWCMATLNNPLLDKNEVIDQDTQKPRSPYWKTIKILGLTQSALIINHHLAHAATYLLSPFKNAVITTCDGGGDYDTRLGIGECFATYRGGGNAIERYDLEIPWLMTGKTYASCSLFIYDTPHYAGKLMALAALGEVRKDYLDIFEKIYREIETVDYPIGDKILSDYFPDLKGTASKNPPSKEATDFCATLQSLFTKRRIENTREVIKQLYKNGDNLVSAGGTGLNLELNTAILNEFPNMQTFIAPCCDDTGQSLGALCLLINEVLGVRPDVKLPYLGMGENEIVYDQGSINNAVDVLLRDGVVILHNGKAEVGPRALGNRSFIVRPDKIDVKQKISEKIKQRESYRPVAPVVLEEKLYEYFTGPANSPLMLHKYEVIKSMQEKIQGGMHHDDSARVQTVNREMNPFLYDLIKEFGDRTGIYVLLNTSLNLRGDPIANAIEDTMKVYNKIDGPKVLVYNGAII